MFNVSITILDSRSYVDSCLFARSLLHPTYLSSFSNFATPSFPYSHKVSITHLNFSKEFAEAVEAKQIAYQDAQRSAYVVDQAKQVW